MHRSKFNDVGMSKEQPLRQQDSDGSGSVVSLQSSSSDDGRYGVGMIGRDPHYERAALPANQVDSGEEADVQREVVRHSTRIDKLQQRLQTDPTENTLDEIISALKNQNGIKDSSSPEMHNDTTTVGSNAYSSMQSNNGSLGWKSSPLLMR